MGHRDGCRDEEGGEDAANGRDNDFFALPRLMGHSVNTSSFREHRRSGLTMGREFGDAQICTTWNGVGILVIAKS
jgi:hypothetical protein